jgi:hypothetical protein
MSNELDDVRVFSRETRRFRCTKSSGTDPVGFFQKILLDEIQREVRKGGLAEANDAGGSRSRVKPDSPAAFAAQTGFPRNFTL